jgi:WXG100 family type VII secretion target
MARITLTPAELRTSATKYTQGASEIRTILQKLEKEQGIIRGNWQGTSFQKFDAQFTSLKPKVTQFAQLLDDINKQLVSVANIIERTDQEIASQINTL